MTPWSKVTSRRSHFDDATAYASVGRLRLDDFAPYIYRTHDGGKTWTAITAGLPDGPGQRGARGPDAQGAALRRHRDRRLGLVRRRRPLAVAPADLPTRRCATSSSRRDLIIATHGRGFWILDDIAPLREAASRLAIPYTFFTPAPAYRIQRDTNTDTPLPPDEPMAANPPDGASSGPLPVVRREHIDTRNSRCERSACTQLSNSDKPEITEEDLKKQLIPLYWVRGLRHLSTEPGMHRWIWDLHYPAPASRAMNIRSQRLGPFLPRGPLGPADITGT